MEGRRPAAGRSAGDILTIAIDSVDWTATLHPRSLAEHVLAALKRRQPDLAWLLADRLVRIGSGQRALPFVLRASAFAQAGDIAAARADLETARQIDPDDRVTNEALTLSDDASARAKGAQHLLLAGDAPGQALALTVLARDGYETVIRSEYREGTLSTQVFLRSGETARITLFDGVREVPVSDLAIRAHDHTDFPFHAELSLPWPQDRVAVALRCEGAPFFAAPAVIRLPRAPGFTEAFASNTALATSPRGLMVIVPVYDDIEGTQDCLTSLNQGGLADLPGQMPCRIVVIDDASPDPRIGATLAQRAAEGSFVLKRNALNLGFAASVNEALALRRAEEDVLLLNADTLVPPGAIAKLARAAYSDPAIGTVTPLSNNGEDTSFPARFAANPMPDPDAVTTIDIVAGEVNRGRLIDMPNGVGFCLYVKAEVVERLGPLSLVFGRGYYEDVEYCLRAARAGYRNVCATDTFVGHSGSRSFKADKRALVRRNLPLLSEQYPDYRAASTAFFRADPLRPAIGDLEEALLVVGGPLRLVVLPEAVPDWLARHLASAEGDGTRTIFARVHAAEGHHALSLSAADDGLPQNIRWSLDGDVEAPVTLRQRLSRLPLASILLVDPFELPTLVTDACRDLAPTDIAYAAAGAPDAGLAGSSAGLGEFRVSTPAAADHLRSLTGGAPKVVDRQADVPQGMRFGQGHLAVLAEDDDGDGWHLARAIASRLKPRDGAAGVAYLGAPATTEPPTREDGVFPTGAITREESGPWLSRLGGAACLVASRAYGLSDPRIDLWSQAGVPMAFFDPRVSRPVRRGLNLSLPIAAAADEVAAAIAAWLADLEQRPAR